MPTIAFISPKGGVGKSTAALVLGLGLAQTGRRVAFIEADANKPLAHWHSLPGRPKRMSIHPAPTPMDLAEALRDTRAVKADWVILDTESTARHGISFANVQPDIVLTPLSASKIEALQALKAAELTQEAGRQLRRPLIHACLLTRLPATRSPRGLSTIVEQLRKAGLVFLSTPLIDSDAFRDLFMSGGDLPAQERKGAPDAKAAQLNAAQYVKAVEALLVRDVAAAA